MGILSPNCTLVELKLLWVEPLNRFARDSKLYLSGIEIPYLRRRRYHTASPNCTLVELKSRNAREANEANESSKLYLSGIEILDGLHITFYEKAPNCTLVELKYGCELSAERKDVLQIVP